MNKIIYQKIKGTKDYYLKEGLKLKFVEKNLQIIAMNYFFKPIKFPVFEYQDLFKKTIGEATDIVNKEMYHFLDRKNRSIVLRPEGTASTMRLILENKLLDTDKNDLRFFYFESMFRYERPQKGRQREFLQFGIEYVNADSIYADYQILDLAIAILLKFEISDYCLELNSIGSLETRQNYLKDLKKYLLKINNQLSKDSQIRLQKNVLRILDTKDQNDLLLLKKAPKIIDYLNSNEKKNLALIENHLKMQNINYKINPFLVRGLDYYNDLVFEFVGLDKKSLGAQATIIGGGRYDFLINNLDRSKNAKAIGFALGVERLMLAANSYIEKNYLQSFSYSIIPISDKYYDDAYKIAQFLRNKGKNIYFNDNQQKFSKKLTQAIKSNFDFVIIIGKEIKNNKIILKDIKAKTEKEISIDKL
ncbi:MAG: histidine--tRNA ligase [Candidatus Hepatoplasma scabrum]|nr:MAG: histidine--tRNA ligase [Candidatus Hepatoplasma sp.]